MMKQMVCAVVGSLCLAACATPGSSVQNGWPEEGGTEDFTAEGRLAVNAEGRGYHANFDWTRQNGVQTIDISTPLGNTLGQLCRDGQGAVAVNGGGEVFSAADPETLSRRLAGGLSLPLQYLDVWADGRRVRGLPHQILPDGSLQQGGWRIERSLNRDGSWNVLSVSNGSLLLKLVFGEVKHGRDENAPTQCEARQ